MNAKLEAAENMPVAKNDPLGRLADNAAEWVHVDDLTPLEKNPRKNDEAAPKLAKLIVKLGFGTPLLAWIDQETGRLQILGGHTRKKAVQILRSKIRTINPRQRAKWHPDAIRTAETGMVPVRVRTDLTPDQARQLAIADNKANEFASWDDQLLAQNLSEFSLQDVGDLGFDVAKYSSDDLGLDDRRSKAGEIEEVNLLDSHADFAMTITGPIEAMQRTVEILRRELSGERVSIETSVSEF